MSWQLRGQPVPSTVCVTWCSWMYVRVCVYVRVCERVRRRRLKPFITLSPLELASRSMTHLFTPCFPCMTAPRPKNWCPSGPNLCSTQGIHGGNWTLLCASFSHLVRWLAATHAKHLLLDAYTPARSQFINEMRNQFGEKVAYYYQFVSEFT